MPKQKEINEWDMTEEEKEELRNLSTSKRALALLTESQFDISQEIVITEKEWWEKVLTRLNLPLNQKPGFKASEISGKIWQK